MKYLNRGILSHWLPTLLLMLISLPVHALETVRDFSELGKLAREKQMVILISVAQDHCPFCHKITEEILDPMLISGDYDDTVLIRQLLIDPWESVVDFEGKTRPAANFADDYKVWVTPTLLFLDPRGKELNPRMLGIQTVEMYGYYVDEAIDNALEKLRDPNSPEYQPTSEDIGAYPEGFDENPFLE